MPESESPLPPWARQQQGARTELANRVFRQQETAPEEAPDDRVEPTTGTGTAIALGCVAGTVFLILIGLLVIGLTILF